MVFDRRATDTSIKHLNPKDTKQLSFGAGRHGLQIACGQAVPTSTGTGTRLRPPPPTTHPGPASQPPSPQCSRERP
eukprot:12592640-Heterocapsa_arctica.AAC.1